MSCSKWRWTKECDGQLCPGDCDFCSLETAYDELKEAEAKYMLSWLHVQVMSASVHEPEAMGDRIYRLDNSDIHINNLAALQNLAEIAGVDKIGRMDYSEKYDKYSFYMDGVEVFCLELKSKAEEIVE